MATKAFGLPQKAAHKGARLPVLWLALCAILAFYALLVWDAGYRQLPVNADPEEAQLLDKVEAAGDRGAPYSEVAADAQRAYPLWNNLTAMVTGTRFGYGSNGNTDPVRYYSTMPPAQKSVLSLHMVLGGVLLILGMFQFTPSFRMKHRKAHRVIGGAYVLCCYVMAFAAMLHMLHAGIANTYQGFAFHIQLWFLAISTVIAQTLALVFIRRRNLPLHLGCQIYTFVAFLNAPIQRLDWVVFGSLYPHLTQGEVNNLVNILTFWQCLLIGAALFAWNRAAAPLRREPAEIIAPAPLPRALLGLAATAAAVTSLAMYVGSPGLGSWTAVEALVPASTLAADARLRAGMPLLSAGFGIAIAAALLSGVWLMTANETSRRARRIFTASALAAGVQQIVWGVRLGEPSMAVTAGGGFYLVSGLSLTGFALLALALQQRGQASLWREAMVFAVGFAFAPALLLWGHGLWHWLDVIPAFYIERGHGYVLAAGAAILTPSFIGFAAMMSSRETRARAIS